MCVCACVYVYLSNRKKWGKFNKSYLQTIII